MRMIQLIKMMRKEFGYEMLSVVHGTSTKLQSNQI